MDPNTGKLYKDIEAARADEVENPVEIAGQLADIQRISLAVDRLHQAEQLEARKNKYKNPHQKFSNKKKLQQKRKKRKNAKNSRRARRN